MGHLGVVLYEYLGEEYPEVLGSILGALKAIVNVIGMTKMTPPIKDLLPRLTPILKNRHEKVSTKQVQTIVKGTKNCNFNGWILISGTRKLYRFSRSYCGQRSGIRFSQRMDENLFRTVGIIESAQKSYS